MCACETSETNCVQCGQCEECCSCTQCGTCDNLIQPDDVCLVCDKCESCCSCPICPDCDAPVKHPCQECQECKDCCICPVCRSCDRPVTETCENCDACTRCCLCDQCRVCDTLVEGGSLCPICEKCDSCCYCWYCGGCEERHNQETRYCPNCDRCPETCECYKGSIAEYHSIEVADELGFFGNPQDKLYLGAELEVEYTGQDIGDQAQEVLDTATYEGKPFVVCQEDGSLNNGFEIITAPATLAIHKQVWTTLLTHEMAMNHLRSHDTSTCGLHVHVSKAGLTQLTIGKILVFVNSPETRPHIIKLARRDKFYNNEYEPKKVSQGGKLNIYRYEAVNLQNAATIEFRVFRGTLNLGTLLATIQFCHALCHWAGVTSIRDIESWPRFWSYVEQNRKMYAELVAYFTKEV